MRHREQRLADVFALEMNHPMLTGLHDGASSPKQACKQPVISAGLVGPRSVLEHRHPLFFVMDIKNIGMANAFVRWLEG